MKTNRSVLLLVAIFPVLAVPGVARSATIPAMAGHGFPNILDRCLFGANAQVTNTCPGFHTLVIPVQTVFSGPISISVWAAGDGGSQGTRCRHSTANGDGSDFASSPNSQTSASANSQQLQLGQTIIVTGGLLQVECDVPQNGRVINIEFHRP
jgi:hypothetical protein